MRNHGQLSKRGSEETVGPESENRQGTLQANSHQVAEIAAFGQVFVVFMEFGNNTVLLRYSGPGESGKSTVLKQLM